MAGFQTMTPPSRLHQKLVTRQQTHHATASRVHHKWNSSENHYAQASPLRRNLFSPEKEPINANTKLTTPLRAKTPQRNYGKTPKRSKSGEYCGLTAEITRELHSIKKTPKRAPIVMNDNPMENQMESGHVLFNSGLQTPPRASRKQDDIFRMPKTEVVTLVPTVSASYSDDTSSKETMPPTSSAPILPPELPPSSAQKAKRSISTPIRMKSKIFSAKKLKKCLTPPREGFASHLKQLRSMCKTPADVESPPSSPASLSTALPGADEFKIHSTEYDPFDFQCELPPKKEMVSHAKICAVVDSYTSVHLNFNFAMLAGLTRSTLEKEYERSSAEKPMIAGACHRDVVKGVLECEDDLIVEGFFREYVGDNNSDGNKCHAKDDRIEVVIFSSEKLRQIIVCFRGSTASQAKPLKTNYFGKEGSSLLHEDHQVRTLSIFRNAYFGTPMENTVFSLLANLATRKPFFDVVMTGHSFGAALATICAVRYATAHPMMRVSCNVFGCPRIGGEDWRQLVHSLANLKVFRVENSNDPYVILPSGSEWIQVGHSISIIDTACSSENSCSVKFAARQFDRDRIASNNGMFDLIKHPKVNLPKGITQGLTTQGKVDHAMKSYVDKLTTSGEKWFTDFVGMNGNGVISFADNERRLLA